jgi:hypothetical protein
MERLSEKAANHFHALTKGLEKLPKDSILRSWEDYLRQTICAGPYAPLKNTSWVSYRSKVRGEIADTMERVKDNPSLEVFATDDVHDFTRVLLKCIHKEYDGNDYESGLALNIYWEALDLYAEYTARRRAYCEGNVVFFGFILPHDRVDQCMDVLESYVRKAEGATK